MGLKYLKNVIAHFLATILQNETEEMQS